MGKAIELVQQLKVGNTLGECVIWDHRQQCLYWTDILAKQFYRWDFNGQPSRYPCPQGLCSFGLSTHQDWLIAAFDSGFAFFHPLSGQVLPLTQVEANQQHTRMNDGRVDRQGRFWAGTMRKKNSPQCGALYRLEDNYQAKKMLDDVHIANSLCWSPDAKIMYFADSAKQVISRSDFDPQSGEFKNSQPWITTPAGAFPDGSCIDSEGFLWNAQWGSATVKRYDPSGQLVLTLDIPCEQPSCVCFGGPNLNHLFVTSAADGMPSRGQVVPANDGDLFVYHTPFQGLHESICRLTLPVQTTNNEQSNIITKSRKYHGQ